MRFRWKSIFSPLAFAAVLLSGCGRFFISTSGGGGTTSTDCIYVGDSGSQALNLVAYTLSSSGSLTQVSGSPYALGFTPTAMTVTKNNKFLYLADYNSGNFYGYTIGTTCALTAIETTDASANLVTGATPTALAADPTSSYLFALDDDGVTLSEFSIDPTTGLLTTVASPPSSLTFPTTPSNSTSEAMTFSPDGNHIFLAMGAAGEIVLSFSESTGAVTQLYNVSGTTNSLDRGVAVDSTSTHLYVSSSAVGLKVFSLDTTGKPTQLTGSPYTTGAGPFGVSLDSTGDYIYTANWGSGPGASPGSSISGFSIGASESLTKLTGSPFTAGIAPLNLAIDNTGKYLVLINQGGTPDEQVFSLTTGIPAQVGTGGTGATANPTVLAVTH